MTDTCFCENISASFTNIDNTLFFNENEKILLHTIPKHVAIIPDGNRRWAEQNNESIAQGYISGAHRLIETTLAAKELGIKYLTFFSFSTENWLRPKEEISIFLQLMEIHLLHYAESLTRQGICLQFIGDITQLPVHLQKTIHIVSEKTAHNGDLFLILAMNYGGRNEIVRAIQKIIQEFSKGHIDHIDETLISSYLDTANYPDPDLIIRTSGENRLSNFLLWQSSYAEMYNDSVFWPDFSTTCFLTALYAFQERLRRHGGG